MNKVQNRLFEMGVVVTKILDKYNIKYLIIFGTLLGAVRHKGFIPWDDDFDIAIFDEDYSRAIATLRKELPNNLFLEDEKSEPLFFHAWAHVKDCRSIVNRKIYKQDDYYLHKGLMLDLYRIKKMKRSQVENYLNKENYNYILRRFNKGLMSKQEYDDRILKLNEKIQEDNKILYKEDRDVFVSVYFYFEFDDIIPLSLIKFENHMFFCPHKPNNVLKTVYDDYMTLPPKEKRISHFSSVEFIK